MTRQVWFVTGASKGFGLCTVKALLKEGLQVTATTRSVPALLEAVGGENPSLLPLEVDLTSDAAIKAAVDKTVEKFGQIDVVLNNAGYGVTGAVEEVSNDEIRRLFFLTCGLVSLGTSSTSLRLRRCARGLGLDCTVHRRLRWWE